MDKLETVRQAGEDEVSKWTDTRFGSVDVVGIRTGRDYGLSKVGKDNESDPRFAPLDSRGNSLKLAVEEMTQDPEVIERVARETRNPDLLAQVTEEREMVEAKKFMAANPDYFGSDENYEAIRSYLAQHDLEFREPNISRAFKSLLRSGEIEVEPGTGHKGYKEMGCFRSGKNDIVYREPSEIALSSLRCRREFAATRLFSSERKMPSSRSICFSKPYTDSSLAGLVRILTILGITHRTRPKGSDYLRR